MIQAVIFDMDGLMVNSEPNHYKAFATVLGNLEGPNGDDIVALIKDFDTHVA